MPRLNTPPEIGKPSARLEHPPQKGGEHQIDVVQVEKGGLMRIFVCGIRHQLSSASGSRKGGASHSAGRRSRSQGSPGWAQNVQAEDAACSDPLRCDGLSEFVIITPPRRARALIADRLGAPEPPESELLVYCCVATHQQAIGWMLLRSIQQNAVPHR